MPRPAPRRSPRVPSRRRLLPVPRQLPQRRKRLWHHPAKPPPAPKTFTLGDAPARAQANLRQAHLVFDRALPLDRLLLLPILRTLLPLVRLLHHVVERDVVCAAAVARLAGRAWREGGGPKEHLLPAFSPFAPLARMHCASRAPLVVAKVEPGGETAGHLQVK